MDFITKDNPLTKEVNDYVARPVNLPSHDFQDMLEEITRSGSILKLTETKAVIETYWDIIGSYIEKGEEYRDDYVSVSFSITGTFEEEERRFDIGKHKLNANINVSSRIQARTDHVDLHHVGYERALPFIDSIFDTSSETANETLTPNGMLAIDGNRLKVYSDSLTEDEGVYFLNKATSEEFRSTFVYENKPKRLIVKIPELPAGNYQVVIKNTIHNSTKLRVGYSARTFIVNS